MAQCQDHWLDHPENFTMMSGKLMAETIDLKQSNMLDLNCLGEKHRKEHHRAPE